MFPERERLLLGDYSKRNTGERPRVGIPRALWFWEYFPFFSTFFQECGFDVILSGTSTSSLIHNGVESVAAESCFPVKLAHGHVLDLLEKDVDYIFLPSILRSFRHQGFTESYNCPYVEGSPYMIDAGLGLSGNWEVDVLMPVVDFSLPGDEWKKSLLEVAGKFGVGQKAAPEEDKHYQQNDKRLFDAPLLDGNRGAPDNRYEYADTGQVGVTVSHAVTADRDDADDRQERDNKPEPTGGRIG